MWDTDKSLDCSAPHFLCSTEATLPADPAAEDYCKGLFEWDASQERALKSVKCPWRQGASFLAWDEQVGGRPLRNIQAEGLLCGEKKPTAKKVDTDRSKGDLK